MSNFRQFGFARIRIPMSTIDSLNCLGSQGRQKVVGCDRAIVLCEDKVGNAVAALLSCKSMRSCGEAAASQISALSDGCGTSLRPTKPFPEAFEGSAHERIWNPTFSEFLFSHLSAGVRTT